MIQKIKTLVLSLSLLFVFSAPVVIMPASVLAAAQPTQAVCRGANQLEIPNNATNDPGTGQCADSGEGSATNRVNRLITQIINVLSVIIGIIAVIMIIWGGFKYITSGGSQEKVTSAKNTLLYAIIGLIIVALAQIIVRFILNKATTG